MQKDNQKININTEKLGLLNKINPASNSSLITLILPHNYNFSDFFIKETSTAKNIKDRRNRHNVCRILKIMSERLSNNYYTMNDGLIIFAGINEYGEEILEIIQPEIKINMFYYNCGDKFITDVATDYLSCYSGNIIFANGDMCLIYTYKNGKFDIVKNITANLQKRQKKGGQSALRIARLAEETRHKYVTKIIDNLNYLNRDNITILFGSKEITKMIQDNKTLLQTISYKGFLEFNTKTINDTLKWCKYFDEKQDDEYNDYYEKILLYLDTDCDMSDFDIENKKDMEFYISKNENIEKVNNYIPSPTMSNKYYDKLCGFEYIGIQYFSYINIEEF
jgi:hypothetical protein